MRAREMLRHSLRPTRVEQGRWPEPGDLDLEATLDQPPPWGPEDLCLNRIVPREAEVLAVLDTSLSMTGEKIALVAVAVAILQLKLDSVALVSFDTDARTLVPVGRSTPLRETIRRVLEVPAQGYTNIEGGLEKAAEELARSRRHERVAILFTDGVYNVGWDPVRQAPRLPRLHVVQVGRPDRRGTRTCRRLAQAGRGRIFLAQTHEDLPEVTRQAIRRLFRA